MRQKLSDICVIQYGYPFDSKLFNESEGTPLIRIRDVKRGYTETFTVEKVSEEYMVTEGDILVGMDGEFNISKWGKTPAALNQRVCKIIPKNKVCADYLYYALPLQLKEIEVKTSFATVKHLSAKVINNIEIEVLSMQQQINIAEILNNISLVIENRKRQIECLDNLVKSRFIELFGDVILNNKEWKIYKFSEIAVSRLGKMLDSKQQTGRNTYPYLANFNVQWFRFDFEKLNEMDFDDNDRIEFELRDGDLLICEGGEIGRCAVWHNELQPCFFQKALHRVRCDHHVVHPDYLVWWFKYNCDNGGFDAIAGAKATIAHLPGVKLKQLKVAVPPVELQKEFATFIKQIDKSKVAIQKSLNETQLLFDSLMQKYFG